MASAFIRCDFLGSDKTMVITEQETFEMKNVLSFRGKMTQNEIGQYGKMIEKVILENHVRKIGLPVTATFSGEQGKNGEAVIDIEFLIPVDKEIDNKNLTEGYSFKREIFLTNAVKLHHVGHPTKLQHSINELKKYITEHQLVPITVGYNVTVYEPQTPLEMDQTEIDIYVGISPNRL